MLMIRLNLDMFWGYRRRSILGSRLLDLQLFSNNNKKKKPNAVLKK